MSDIANIAGNLGSAQVPSLDRPETAIRPTPGPTPRHGRGVDAVEISDDARRMGVARANERNPADLDKVARIRAEIQAGTYDTEARFQVAANLLMRDL
ncbi:MAG: flagellar biosynthesis anti-sigma factor FlgM [Planctomycetota bacterium]|nr:flagellar biosynthesis anti-sigma factor FlgM [Planctomycetota bacterium]